VLKLQINIEEYIL